MRDLMNEQKAKISSTGKFIFISQETNYKTLLCAFNLTIIASKQCNAIMNEANNM